MARSSSGDFAIRYVLPVLWMTSSLARVGHVAMREISVAKYSAHTEHCETGAESDVYECFVLVCGSQLVLCECCRTYLNVARVAWSARCAAALNVLASATKDTIASM